ncbi:hypothetical protein [Endozoicomonas elysicola]|nr:hypothetical protein [Endozoicomonas elysicola]
MITEKSTSPNMAIIFARIIVVCFSFLSFKLSVTLLNPEEVGRMHLILGLTSFYSMLIAGPVYLYLHRSLFYLIATLNMWRTIKRLLQFLIVTLLIYCFFISWVRTDTNSVTLVLFFYILINCIYEGILPNINLLGRFKLFALASVFGQAFSLVISLTLCFLYEKSAISWITGMIVGQTITILCVRLYMYKNISEVVGGFQNPFENTRSVLSFLFPLAYSALATWVALYSQRYLIESSMNIHDVAVFSVILAIALNLIGVLNTLAQQILLPKFYQACANDRADTKEAWHNYFRTAIPYLTFFVSVGGIFSSELVKLFTNSVYELNSILLLWFLISEYFKSIGVAFDVYLHGMGDTVIMYKISTVILFGSSISYLFAYYYKNIYAFAYAYLVISISTLLVKYILIVKKNGLCVDFSVALKGIKWSAPLGLLYIFNYTFQLHYLVTLLFAALISILCLAFMYSYEGLKVE